MNQRPRVLARHVAFDLDGTLVDSSEDLAAAVNHVVRARGHASVPTASVRRFVGHGARVLIERALGPQTEDDMRRAVDEFLDYYGAHCLDETRPYDGMVELLSWIEGAAVTMSVVTNKPERLARRIIEGLGLTDRFVALVGGDSLPTKKPDPAGLVHVAAVASVRPTEVLLVGDSPVDLQTAERAGAAFCGVAWGFAPDELHERSPRALCTDAASLRDRLRDVLDSGAGAR